MMYVLGNEALALTAMLSLAALWDLKELRVPNPVILLGAVWGMPASGTPVCGLRIAASLTVLYPLAGYGFFGAGDCKLTAVLIGVLGVSAGLRVLGYSLFCSLPLVLAVCIRDRKVLGAGPVPFASAMLLGYLLYLAIG